MLISQEKKKKEKIKKEKKNNKQSDLDSSHKFSVNQWLA